jgi:mono/diheme cytochrome c family protein
MAGPVVAAVGEWPHFIAGEMNDLIAYTGGDAASLKPQGQAVRGDAERGWRQFQAKCIECHAVRGQGGTSGPELGPEKDLPLSTAEFASLLWNHAPAMAKQAQKSGHGLPAISGTEMHDLVAFLASLRYYEPSGSPVVGERVFAARGCARCHGSKAEGTRWAQPLRPAGEAFTTVSFATALWRHGPRMQERAEEMGLQWPVLQPADIGDLISFLNYSEPLQ